MHVATKGAAPEPVVPGVGERIYEMIGDRPELGDSVKHSVAHVVIEPGKSSASHRHGYSEETYYILRGAGRMAIDTTRWPARPGMAFFIAPGEVHQIFNEGEDDLEFIAVCAPAWTADDSFAADLPDES